MASQWTGKQRIATALKGQYSDTVPLSLPVSRYGATLVGCPVRDFYWDPEKRLRGLVIAQERFQPDAIGIGYDPPSTAEAIGGELTEEVTLSLRAPVLGDKGALAGREVPDPKGSGRFLAYQEVCARAASELRDTSVGGAIMGPWTLAMMMRGAETLIYDTADDPAFVHELMRFTTEVFKAYGLALRETGVGLTMADPSASCSLISPRLYRTFVKPYHVEIVNLFKERKTWISLHICGYIDPIMEDLLATGVGSISLDGPSSLEKLVALAQKKVAAIGNVPTELFVAGAREEMGEAVGGCIEAAALGGKYILCSGCAIPLNSPVEKVGYFVEVSRRLGSEFISRLGEAARPPA